MKLSSYPHLAKEWHPTKNGEFTPKDFTKNIRKKVWWLCPKNHSYESYIRYRTEGRNSCPYCSNRKACEDNNLQLLFPETAKDWHPTKNVALTSKDVVPGSGQKAWWLCSKGHSYDALVKDRTRKQTRGCPFCSGRRSLNLELWK